MSFGKARDISRAPFRAVAGVVVSAVLASCGGGGSDATPVAPAPDVPVTVVPTENPVYAAPSSAGCDLAAAVASCTPPTSSQVSIEALVAGVTNASGTAYRFDAIGWEWDSFMTFAGSQLVSGVSNYALLEEPLVIGRNQVTDASGTHAFSRALDTGSLEFGITNHTLQIGLFQGGPALAAIRNDVYAGASGNGSRGVKSWHPTLGLLTDTLDAPKDAVLTYTGGLYVIAGDGSVVPPTFVKNVSGGCPITLSLDTANGALTTTAANCTDAQTGAVIQFSMDRLFFRGARVSGVIGSEADIAIDAPIAGIPAAGQVTLNFRSAHIGGALYGAAAKVVAISGSSPSGAFQIIATHP